METETERLRAKHCSRFSCALTFSACLLLKMREVGKRACNILQFLSCSFFCYSQQSAQGHRGVCVYVCMCASMHAYLHGCVHVPQVVGTSLRVRVYARTGSEIQFSPL